MNDELTINQGNNKVIFYNDSGYLTIIQSKVKLFTVDKTIQQKNIGTSSQLNQMSKLKVNQIPSEWTTILNSINKYKAKKLLWMVADINSSLKRFLMDNHIAELRIDTLEEVLKKVDNTSVMFGFRQYFQRIQNQKIKQFTKEMDKVFDEFNYYGAKIQVSREVQMNISNQKLSKITDDLINFEEKYGKFTKISDQVRIRSKIIDTLCHKISRNNAARQ